MRQTHTYVILPVSAAAYREIRAKLVEAGYSHALGGTVGTPDEVIDMHGIAVQREREEEDGD